MQYRAVKMIVRAIMIDEGSLFESPKSQQNMTVRLSKQH